MSEKERLDYLRGEIESERISYEEIAELQSLVDSIDPGDVLLLEWAGVPEQESPSPDDYPFREIGDRVFVNNYDITREDADSLMSGIKWLGMDPSSIQRVDICDDGSAYVGLTQIVPKKTITSERRYA